MKEAGIEHSRMWFTFLKLIPFSVGKTLRQGRSIGMVLPAPASTL